MYSTYGNFQRMIIYSLPETCFFLSSDTRGEIVYFKINTHGQIKYNLMYRSRKMKCFPVNCQI